MGTICIVPHPKSSAWDRGSFRIPISSDWQPVCRRNVRGSSRDKPQPQHVRLLVVVARASPKVPEPPRLTSSFIGSFGGWNSVWYDRPLGLWINLEYKKEDRSDSLSPGNKPLGHHIGVCHNNSSIAYDDVMKIGHSILAQDWYCLQLHTNRQYTTTVTK